MSNAMIIGGTGGLAQTIIKELENNDHTIDLITYRSKSKVYGTYDWQYLDLENIDSINNLIAYAKNKKFSKIILIVGNTLGSGIKSHSYEDLTKYHTSFYINYVYMISKFVDMLDHSGQLVFISSIAANRSIPDANYSAVKAGIQAFIKSLSGVLTNEQVAYSIAPGLILDTKAFYDSSYNGDISKLATKEQIAKIISNGGLQYHEQVFEIGY